MQLLKMSRRQHILPGSSSEMPGPPVFHFFASFCHPSESPAGWVTVTLQSNPCGQFTGDCIQARSASVQQLFPHQIFGSGKQDCVLASVQG